MEIDTTKPNSARIYDYLLGGKHNYPVDRAAAKRLLEVEPSAAEGVLLFRYFLHRVVRKLSQSGFTCYLDLATGLPTEGYIHELVPESTRIIYNDIDPQAIAYARQILGERSNILLMQGDLREIDPVLERADQFFEGERRIGICLVNVAYHIDDESLAYVLQRLYNWSAPGSQLAISCVEPAKTERLARVHDYYRSIGTPLYPRTPDEFLRLIGPWQVIDELRPIESYTEESLQIRTLENNEVKGNIGFGGILGH